MATRVVRVLLCCLVVLCGFGVGSVPVAVADSPTAAPSVETGGEFAGLTAPSLEAIQDGDGDGGEDGADGDGEQADPTEQAEPTLAGYDEISVEIDLYRNGSADWTFEYRYRLDDGNQSVDWEELRGDVEDRPEAYLESFEDRRDETLAAAEEQTGRNMSMTNFGVETDESSTPHEYGYVRFTFYWSSFAYVEGPLIEAGDALDGFTMTEETQLVISWPEEYENASVTPEPDDRGERTVIWYGDETREFVDGEPRVELIHTGGEPIQSPEESDSLLPVSWPVALAGLAAVLVVLGGAAWLWSARGGGEPLEESIPPPASTASEEPAESPEPPLELLSNEERVMRLLETRGGRIKQQEVVSELDWTEAKTSQVVSGLRESGEIEVFRIGRENVLSLPEDEDEDDDDGTAGPAEPGAPGADDS